MTFCQVSFKWVGRMANLSVQRIARRQFTMTTIACPLGIFRYQQKVPSGQDMEFFEGGSGGTFLHKKVPPVTSPFPRRRGHA